VGNASLSHVSAQDSSRVTAARHPTRLVIVSGFSLPPASAVHASSVLILMRDSCGAHAGCLPRLIACRARRLAPHCQPCPTRLSSRSIPAQQHHEQLISSHPVSIQARGKTSVRDKAMMTRTRSGDSSAVHYILHAIDRKLRDLLACLSLSSSASRDGLMHVSVLCREGRHEIIA
jgi:hypothetical protein